ncbi:MAG: hypothetical protein ACKN9V_04555 [Pseudomonadota bacterium]
MLTRILAILAPAIFLFFTACSGGNSKPPQSSNTDDGNAVEQSVLDNLYDHANRAKASCAVDYTPVMVLAAQQYLAAPQIPCGAGGGAIPGNPGMGIPGGAIPSGPGAPILATFDPFSVAVAPQAQPQAAGIYPGAPVCGTRQVPQIPVPQPKTDTCKNDLKNLIATFSTIKSKNGKVLYANLPQAQQWLAETLGGLINQIGGNVQAQLPGAPMQDPNFQAFLLAQGGRAALQMAPQTGSAIPMQLLQQYMGQVPTMGIPMNAFQQYLGG